MLCAYIEAESSLESGMSKVLVSEERYRNCPSIWRLGAGGSWYLAKKDQGIACEREAAASRGWIFLLVTEEWSCRWLKYNIVLYLLLSLCEVQHWHHPFLSLSVCPSNERTVKSQVKGWERDIWRRRTGIHKFASVRKWRAIVGSDFQGASVGN